MVSPSKRSTPGFTQEVLQVREDMNRRKKAEARYRAGDLTIEAVKGRDTLWFKVSKPDSGGIALRSLFSSGDYRIDTIETAESGITADVENKAGRWRIEFIGLGERLLRLRVTLTPTMDLLVPFWPRDLYVLDVQGDPTQTKGYVEAGQRGYNTGLCYFTLQEPAFGRVLYVQNLSALNDYFIDTATRPDGVVGGEWPELGYQPPAAPNGNSPPEAPLMAGKSYVVSDAIIGFSFGESKDETASARNFVNMIADIYPYLDKPEPAFHDWPERAEKTLHDLKTAPEAIIRHYGHVYLHPYTASEYPDSMVQLSVASAIDELEALTGRKEPYKDELLKGMNRFYDKELCTLRRYLPNVGDDKNADAVDSWYLYHPLMNLGRLAIDGHEASKTLFLKSLDYAVKSARHFNYLWPIQYDVKTFEVITATRGDGYGQTDVAGIYAYVMIQAYQLTEDPLYLDEAKAAMTVAEGMRFELIYQANLTAWGIAACVKLWKLEEDERYLAQAEVFLASFVHNSLLWDSQIEHARHYSNFFGVTCLHDAPYMAAYECFESFSAFDEVLQFAGEELPPKMKLLLAEYRRFAFDRSWAYYPDALPEEAVAKDNIRNGHIDRNLSFPLEDLYGDGQAAGQVGQEIYGCGGAFIIAARGFYQRNIPFRIFSDYPYSLTLNNNSAQITLKGPADYPATVHLLTKEKTTLPKFTVSHVGPETTRLRARKGIDGGQMYKVPAEAVIQVSWEE